MEEDLAPMLCERTPSPRSDPASKKHGRAPKRIIYNLPLRGSIFFVEQFFIEKLVSHAAGSSQPELLYIDRASYQLERSSAQPLVKYLLRRVIVGQQKNTKDPSSNKKRSRLMASTECRSAFDH